MKNIIIAIDGFSSTGKSTIAKRLARKLNYIYVDTGAMYRAVTLFALRNDLVTEGKVDHQGLLRHLDEMNLRFLYKTETGTSDMILNDENVEQDIRSMRVSDMVSQVAKIPEVRTMLVRQQRRWGDQKGIVMDGRDIGTVVFPKAELKLFMTASAKTRAERRFKELRDNGEQVSFEAVLKNIETRDHIDSTRKDSPLRKADDAVEIDNSHLSREEQFEMILALAKQRIAAQTA